MALRLLYQVSRELSQVARCGHLRQMECVVMFLRELKLKPFWVMSIPGLVAFLFARVALASMEPVFVAPFLAPDQLLPLGVTDSRLNVSTEPVAPSAINPVQTMNQFEYGGMSFSPSDLLQANAPLALFSEPAHPWMGLPAMSAMIPDLTVKPMFEDPNVNPFLNAPGFRIEDHFGRPRKSGAIEREPSSDEESSEAREEVPTIYLNAGGTIE